MDTQPALTQPPRLVRYLFWLLLGCLSTYLAEVPSGSFIWPFFLPMGILITTPLYTLHILLLGWLVFRFGPPRFSTLYIAGALFGMYEAYITKVLWLPTWLEPDKVFLVGGIAINETILLVFAWHPLLAFILPLLVAESQCTGTRETARAMPRRIRGLWTTPRKRIRTLCGLALFLGLFLSGTMKEQPPVVLMACMLSGLVPLGLIHLVRKRNPNSRYSMRSLLPRGWEVGALAGLLLLMYLVMGIFVRREVLPGILEGQLTVWLIYAAVIGLLTAGLVQSSRLKPPPPVTCRHGWLSLRELFCFGLILGLTASLTRVIMGNGTVVWVLSIWMFLLGLAFILTFISIREVIRDTACPLKGKEEHAESA